MPLFNSILGFNVKASTALSHTTVSVSAVASSLYGFYQARRLPFAAVLPSLCSLFQLCWIRLCLCSIPTYLQRWAVTLQLSQLLFLGLSLWLSCMYLRPSAVTLMLRRPAQMILHGRWQTWTSSSPFCPPSCLECQSVRATLSCHTFNL